MFRKYIRSGNGQLFRNTSIIAQISDSGKRFDKGFHNFPGNLQRRHNARGPSRGIAAPERRNPLDLSRRNAIMLNDWASRFHGSDGMVKMHAPQALREAF